jgi:hypothetical protein
MVTTFRRRSDRRRRVLAANGGAPVRRAPCCPASVMTDSNDAPITIEGWVDKPLSEVKAVLVYSRLRTCVTWFSMRGATWNQTARRGWGGIELVRSGRTHAALCRRACQ